MLSACDRMLECIQESRILAAKKAYDAALDEVNKGVRAFWILLRAPFKIIVFHLISTDMRFHNTGRASGSSRNIVRSI